MNVLLNGLRNSIFLLVTTSFLIQSTAFCATKPQGKKGENRHVTCLQGLRYSPANAVTIDECHQATWKTLKATWQTSAEGKGPAAVIAFQKQFDSEFAACLSSKGLNLSVTQRTSLKSTCFVVHQQ